MQDRRKDDQTKKKRVLNACKRCRKHKIKCTGTHPCKTCDLRSLNCEFDVEEKKVVVSEKYLNDLKRKLSGLGEEETRSDRRGVDLTRHDSSLPPEHAGNDSSSLLDPSLSQTHLELGNPTVAATQDGADESRKSSVEEIQNPLVQSSYTLDASGRLRHFGHSSTWAFSQQVLQITQNRSPLIGSSVNADGEVYPLDREDWPSVDWSLLPSKEVALFLIETVKFRIGSLFHLFDNSDIQIHLDRLYTDPPSYWRSERLGLIRFLVIVALGKSIASTGQAGLKIFKHALKLLPDLPYLCWDPAMSAELLCIISLYLLCIDHRNAAHLSIGQALRLAQSHGLHTNVQARDVGQATLERFRRIWWTIYCLDRRMSTLMGLAHGLYDQDITAPLTSAPDLDKAFILNVRLNEQFGKIVSTVYNVNGRLNTALIPTAQTVLRGIAGLSEEIHEYANNCFGISRAAAHLQLAYHQCIMLTTRPFLFHLLQKGLESGDLSTTFPLSGSIKGLVQASVDSAIQAVFILKNLLQHDLLDAFLPFDLDGAFSAAFILLMSHRIHPKLVPDTPWLNSLLEIFDTMISEGSLLSKLRKQEVEELNTAMQNLNTRPQRSTDPGEPESIDPPSLPSLGDPFFGEWNPDDGISGAQLLNLADELNNENLIDFWMQETGPLQDSV